MLRAPTCSSTNVRRGTIAGYQCALRTHRKPVCTVRRSSRWQHDCCANSNEKGLSHQLFEWAKARTNAMQVDVEKLDDNPRATDTVLLSPWRSVLVPRARIESLKTFQYYYCSPSIRMWNIGYGRAVTNCNMYDINPGAIVPQNVIKHKVGRLNLAADLGNVSRACKVMGFPRDTFCRYQSAVAGGKRN